MATISVAVGNGSDIFSPNNIKANIGDIIEFDFYPKDHSVAQASFSDPCHPLVNGFYSNYVPTSISPSNTTFSILINDSKPIYFYCSQHIGYHCQTGEVGVINAPDTGNTLEAFALLAKNATNSTSPLAPDAGAVGGFLGIKGESSGNTTLSLSPLTIISTPTNIMSSSTAVPTMTSSQTNIAVSQSPMTTMSYSIIAIAVLLLIICLSGAAGFWLYRKQGKVLPGVTGSQERVHDHQLSTSDGLQANQGCIIQLAEMSGIVQSTAELPSIAMHDEGEGLQDLSCQESNEVHSLSFV